MNFSHKYLVLFLISFNSINAIPLLIGRYLPRLVSLKRFINPNPVNSCFNRTNCVFNQNILPIRRFSKIYPKKIVKKFADVDFYDLDSRIDSLINSVSKNSNRISDFEFNLALKYLNPDFNLSRKIYLQHRENYKKLLLKYNQLVHSVFGKYLFFNAVFISDAEMVLLLLKLGIDINQTISIIENEEIPIINFANDNIRSVVALYEKYYLKTY